jgi:uncharacterized protein (TIGR03437 family)
VNFKTSNRLIALIALSLPAVFAQPVVTALLNNYGDILPGLPNYGIAQGSIFNIYGSGLANSTTALQAVPLQTALGGVTVSVSVSGTTVKCPIYSLSPGQINAILPSSTPVGTGTITVVNNGQTSATFSVKVVQSAFGMLTLNGAGTGPAAVFDANHGNAYVLFTAAASPGDTIVLWGTGLGPVTGDETQPQTQQDLTNIPIEVDIGGLRASVLYHGRSQFPGLDQINVVIPNDVLQGCHIPVSVQIGNVVSNFATIAVARNGSTCSDPISLSSDQITKSQTNGSYSQGLITLTRINAQITIPILGTVPVTSDQGTASFGRYTAAQLLSASYPVGFVSTLGVCNVYTFKGTGIQFPTDPVQATSLDAGAVINVTGPNGSKQMAKSALGGYSALLGGIDLNTLATSKNYLDPGSYTVDNGTGGTGATAVGAFKATVTVGQPVSWTNQSAVSNVDRTKSLQLTWTGADPNGYVAAFGLSATTGASAGFFCSAKSTDNQVTIPAAVLLSLPVNSGAYIGVLGASANTPFTATGLDSGAVVVLNATVKTAAYQ